MKAIVLVGGEGTRLRPLTWQTPKALVPVLNRPLLERLLLHLRLHGVSQVTLAMTRRSEAIEAAFGTGRALGISVAYAYEETPLGSGGAIASVAAGWDETFLVCNGDIITDLDVAEMIAAHRARRAELSISLHEVEDPSPFGVVDLDETGRIRRFVEKPAPGEAPSRLINAGTWIFEAALLREMDASRFNRVEETLFADLAHAGRGIVGFHRPGRWADIGSSAALLRVNLELAAEAAMRPAGSPLGGDAVSPRATVHDGATIEEPCVIGARSAIERGAHVAQSLIWDDVRVEAGATVSGSILATGVRVGAGATVRDSVIAHGADIEAGAHVIDASIEPGASILNHSARKVGT